MSILKKWGLLNDEVPIKKEKPVVAVNPLPTTTQLPADDKFTDFFKKVIEDNNLKGPDYYEFFKAIEAMAGQPLPENSKFQAIFAGFAAQGITKQSLIDSAKFYLGKLDEHNEGFEQSLTGLHTQEVESRQAKINAIQKRKQEIATHMQQLNDELVKISGEEVTLSTEMTTKSNEILSKRASFKASLENFKQTIQSNIQKLEQYVS